MKTLSRDARLFVDEVAKFVRSNKDGKTVAPRVQALIGQVTSAAQKERVAQVHSAVALTAEEKVSVTRILVQILSHEVQCRFEVDKNLLGGLKIQVADWVVDTSLSSQLSVLTHSLL